jgi:hypothetical protein
MFALGVTGPCYLGRVTRTGGGTLKWLMSALLRTRVPASGTPYAKG